MMILQNLVLTSTAVIWLLAAGPVWSDTFRDGGLAYRSGDYETAAVKFREVAEKGDHRAMYALGSMYAAGQGVEQDYQQAFTWFSRAAKYGRPDALYKLGLMYDEGIGIKQNYNRAIRLYDAAARQGYTHAQFRMGLLYARGNGVSQNDIKAYGWLKAAEENYARDRQRSGGEEAEDAGSGDIFAGIHGDLIEVEIQNISSRLSPAGLEEARQLAQKYLQYQR